MNNAYVKCFGSLSFEVHEGDKKSPIDMSWRTAKSKELFCYLLHHREKSINKEKLIDLLWPNLDVKAGFSQLYSSIYSIRLNFEKVGLPIVIRSMNDSYYLETKNIKVDVDDFENIMENEKFDIGEFQKALKLYKGDYLENEYYSWAFNKQEQVQLMILKKTSQATAHFESTGNYLDGILLNIKVKEIFPEMIFAHENLIRLYNKIGHTKFAKRCEVELASIIDSEEILN